MRTSSLLARMHELLHARALRWAHDSLLLAELFAVSNLAVLAADICIAHAMNHFRKPAEYIPLLFSLLAPVVLLIGIYLRWFKKQKKFWKIGGQVVGWMGVLVGLAGVLYHLESSFFLDSTLRSLTYAAPFAAPLAYSGLGFLILANRMVEERSQAWARWLLFLTLGGFFGNFVLALTDHAENGFFERTEWIPVCSAALATGFLLVPLILPVTRRFLDGLSLVLLLQILVGLAGFWFHLRANLVLPGVTLWDKLVFGAPPMAPLLYPNMVALAAIGLWALLPYISEAEDHASWLGTAYDWAHPQSQNQG